MRAEFFIFALAALVALGENTRQIENTRAVRSPGPVIDTRIFGNWSLVQNTAVSNASDAKFMDYLECQKIPIAIAANITRAIDGRLIMARDNGTSMGINLIVLTPPHGDQMALPEFRFNDRFSANWFSKTPKPAMMDMMVVRDCYYPAGGTSDVNICGFRHITYPLNATEYYEEYTYRCSDDGQRLTISYLTHGCGPATRTYKRYRQKPVDIERPIDDRIFEHWYYNSANITNFQNFLMCTGHQARHTSLISRHPIILHLERKKERAVEATYNVVHEFLGNILIRGELLRFLYKNFRLNERFTQASIFHPYTNKDMVFERYCYMTNGTEECGLRQLMYEAGDTRYTSSLTYTMADDGKNLRVVSVTASQKMFPFEMVEQCFDFLNLRLIQINPD